MKQEIKLTAINPFAVAEQVLGKKVKWDSLEDPEETLSSVFNVPKKELFAHDSILINPMLSEKRELLSAEKAQARLKQFLDGKSAKRLSLKKSAISDRVALKEISSKTMEAIFAKSTPAGTSNNTEWNPSNVVWLDKGDYFEDLAELTDPIQGGLADCYFISALCSVAWSRPYAILNSTSPYGDEESPLHQVFFYNEKGVREFVEVDELCPCNPSTQRLIYASSYDEGEIWPAVMEKAYAKWKTGNTTQKPDYSKLAWGDPVEACRQLIGGTPTYMFNNEMTARQISNVVRYNSLDRKTINPMVAWTYSSQPAGCDYASAHIVASHAYSILGWDNDGSQYYVVLRNPWGTYPGVLDRLGGNYAGVINRLWNAFPYGQNGVFAMKVETFKKYFYGFGVVK